MNVYGLHAKIDHVGENNHRNSHLLAKTIDEDPKDGNDILYVFGTTTSFLDPECII